MAVNLSVHRNKIESRRKRELAKLLTNQVNAMVKEQDIRAYAVVGIGSSGDAFALWDTGGIMPIWAFSSAISHILAEDVRASGLKDDWRPTLPVKG